MPMQGLSASVGSIAASWRKEVAIDEVVGVLFGRLEGRRLTRVEPDIAKDSPVFKVMRYGCLRPRGDVSGIAKTEDGDAECVVFLVSDLGGEDAAEGVYCTG
jgi:hypothetical protein